MAKDIKFFHEGNWDSDFVILCALCFQPTFPNFIYCTFLYFIFKTVYSAITFAGYIGVMTGQKPNSFSVTVDQRSTFNLFIILTYIFFFKNHRVTENTD